MSSSTLSQICDWYASQCNGEWEHGAGIRIETLDNPGWSVEIDLARTNLEEAKLEKEYVEQVDHTWYFAEIRDKRFYGAADPKSLESVLGIFLGLLE